MNCDAHSDNCCVATILKRTIMGHSFRRAARLIVLDSAGRLLLVQYDGSSGPFWATPGGGLEDGEDFETAARREMHEELGVLPVSLTTLWEQDIRYRSNGRDIRQQERFFLAHCDVVPSDFASRLIQHEREGIRDIRWWTLADLEHTRELVFPDDLFARLARLVLS